MHPGSSVLVALTLALAACHPGRGGEAAPVSPPRPTGPYVRVLGTVQDGGLPHAACRCRRCVAARDVPALARRVASLAVVEPASGRVFLVDATPDIRRQLDEVRDLSPSKPQGVDRTPVDGVLLTHAHLGHYTGLAFFGFEAIHTRGIPVLCSPSMADFLLANEPWARLAEIENIRIRRIEPDRNVRLAGDVTVRALAVPHRDELSDTLGFLFRGPSAALLYVPDTDGWTAWDPPIERLVAEVDYALLDGTFYSLDELPGRDVSSIGHPLIVDSMDRLEPLVREGHVRVYFTHLNHSNPALDPDGAERAEILRRGFAVLDESREFEL